MNTRAAKSQMVDRLRLELRTSRLSAECANLLRHLSIMVDHQGFEPWTWGLWDPCSRPNWANGPLWDWEGSNPLNLQLNVNPSFHKATPYNAPPYCLSIARTQPIVCSCEVFGRHNPPLKGNFPLSSLCSICNMARTWGGWTLQRPNAPSNGSTSLCIVERPVENLLL